jgi:hypothetical protein
VAKQHGSLRNKAWCELQGKKELQHIMHNTCLKSEDLVSSAVHTLLKDIVRLTSPALAVSSV